MPALRESGLVSVAERGQPTVATCQAMLTRGTAAAFLSLWMPAVLSAQSAGSLPFAVGEHIEFLVRVPRMGTVGRGAMWVEGPVDVRGVATLLLRFDSRVRIGPATATDRTSSWLDPRRMASLRYEKRERNPLSRRDEIVDVYPEARRWTAVSGEAGDSPSADPLDELSFIYFMRTLPFTADTTYRFVRHFDRARSPTTVRVVRREALTTAAGDFRTVLVEMRVRDPRRFRGEGVIRINFTDDSVRLPVRIESAMPMVGTGVLLLESYTAAASATVRASRLRDAVRFSPSSSGR